MAWWIFQNVVSTAALVLVVAAVCRLTRNGPVARHALWVLVLIKFVTPPLVVWPWAAPDPFGLAADAEPAASSSVGPPMDYRATGADATAEPAKYVGRSGFWAPSVGRSGVYAGRSGFWSGLWQWVFSLWIAGSLLVIVIEGVRLARVARRVRDTRPVDPAVISRAAELSSQIGLPPVPVIGVSGRDAPAVWAFGRPRLLWPTELAADASDACIDGLLLHELAHIKRCDHFVGWIELAAGVVWWWNPMFWHARSALREQAELACDAWVIAALPNGRRAYAESLLMLSGPEVRGMPPVAVMGIRAGSRRVLERRLVMIMQGRAPLRLSWAGLVALIVLAGATLPAWASAPRQTQQPPPTEPPKVVIKPEIQVKPQIVLKDGQTYTLSLKDQQPPKITVTLKDELLKNYTVKLNDELLKPFDVTVKPKVVDLLLQQKEITAKPIIKEFKGQLLLNPTLPDDGQKLVKNFQAEKDAIQAEADQKIVARRDAVAKALQELQDRYAREGKLDEAVAVRDYIRAGMPGLDGKGLWIKR
jgi:beta-lactamase regulating signal transducer with metallopeptidase domain